MRFTLTHFFRSLRLAAMFWPYDGNLRKQIQSYAVLTLMDDINAENLGQYHEKKGTEYFYSRKWSELLYNPSEFCMKPPYLIAFEPDANASISDPFYKQKSKTRYLIDLYIVDAFKALNTDVESNETIDDFMTIEDMYLEAERKLKSLFSFLESEVVLASLNGGPTTVYTAGYLARIKLDAPITTYEIDSLATSRYREMLTASNENVTVSRWSGGANDLHGVRASINILAYCEDVPAWDYNRKILDEVIQDHGAQQYPEAAALLVELDQDEFGSLDGSTWGTL